MHHSEQPNVTRRPIGRRVPYTSRRFEFTTVWETWRGDSAGWRKVDKVSGKVTTPGWTICKACTWDKSQRRDEIESAEKRHLSLAVKDRPLIRNPQTVHFTITTRLSLPVQQHFHPSFIFMLLDQFVGCSIYDGLQTADQLFYASGSSFIPDNYLKGLCEGLNFPKNIKNYLPRMYFYVLGLIYLLAPVKKLSR